MVYWLFTSLVHFGHPSFNPGYACGCGRRTNISFQSTEILSTRTNHVLPWK